ncbi:LysR family transcriptional regulator ArgP [Thioclava nitratireducens]|uniref:LysR family transcriptional regulator ArgP n=1 Tax=Thioclava nitratireducens TaxID=1915078 RepID=UPI0024808DFD|nr:LysR family transcriptional regulator ArgP [Thioclava nitratireducens]WGT49657.1 LysR family transcriptional regulator ArgP [Thioclava nitratireducens]
MFDYAALDALATVIETGSFEAASARLGVSQSAVSQRVRQLEERMGAVLVIRATPCRATEDGARLIAHLREVALLETELAPSETPPVLRIAVNADSLATWVLPALAEVEGVRFDLVIDDQDHSAGLLRRGEVVGAITADAGPIAGCDSVSLGRLRYIATASPDFVARYFPNRIDRHSLRAAPALQFNAKDRLQDRWASMIAGIPMGLRAHRIGSTEGFVEACLRGMGWGLNPEALVQAHLESGALERLGPAPIDVPLYWQSARRLKAPLAPLTKALRKAAKVVLL